MRTPKPRKAQQGDGGLNEWILAYLRDKTTPLKVMEWQAWARGRMAVGWSQVEVENRIRAAWKEHSLNHDQAELPPELQTALFEVFRKAEEGWTPAQCAVVYRSLHRQYPSCQWLLDWAERWDAAGSDWRVAVMP